MFDCYLKKGVLITLLEFRSRLYLILVLPSFNLLINKAVPVVIDTGGQYFS